MRRVSEQTERRLIALVNNVAGDCGRCLHREKERCDHCRASWARSIMMDVRADQCASEDEDYGFAARMTRILLAVKTAGRPVTASEINAGNCSRKTKNYTISMMVARGMIRRESVGGKRSYVYTVTAP